jgi:16S rRNA (guanine966-N2)-methyltransferase
VDVVRIVAGIAGGRRIAVPRGRSTRPTSERTREALFSTLESLHRTLSGLSFLDLYAGSGAVGLEALSRGATTVWLVESEATALAALRGNVAGLAVPGATVIADRVERLLATPAAQTFDVVFVDPPYRDPVDPVLQRLVDNGWVGDDATIVVERATKTGSPQWPAGWAEDRARRYGDSALWYGRRS